jgi:hypothetical protein
MRFKEGVMTSRGTVMRFLVALVFIYLINYLMYKDVITPKNFDNILGIIILIAVIWTAIKSHKPVKTKTTILGWILRIFVFVVIILILAEILG